MPKRSAGLLLFRGALEGLKLFLVHPGGPFWARKDAGAWSIPKGEYEPGEDPVAVAFREFGEETGLTLAPGALHDLGEARQAGGKVVRAYAREGDADPDAIRSNEFELEWPPRSGRVARFPEVDRAAWFGPHAARAKLVPGQVVFVDRLVKILSEAGPLGRDKP
jgi:predicted NUDIX family NTP pyrophosphohydrolase